MTVCPDPKVTKIRGDIGRRGASDERCNNMLMQNYFAKFDGVISVVLFVRMADTAYCAIWYMLSGTK